MFTTLDDVRRDVADRLIRGAKDRKVPMHSPVVVTSDVDARVMVLRDFDRSTWTLRFHTDARAPKAKVIAADPQMAVLLYDKGAKIQIRAKGIGRIEQSGPVADAAWNDATNFARRCYLGDGPGSASVAPTSGLPDWAEGIQPTDEQIAPARENFAVLLIELQQIDWLYLANSGHQRAQFARGDGSDWSGNWVTP
ncbi:pyridoxamine 5'-phosphate oxidase family protein [Erythrobacter sp. MTPC3]|uniref:pyridoxamine 5'-phosphate oxidase family protein n=1 Tax=Erythrobacter sp. MTPC3 TaxID=3056564 RepID=UPI0036F2BB92